VKRWIDWTASFALGVGIATLTSCGGGRTAVVGLGNSGNRILEAGGAAQALAERLAEHAGTPMVSDELLGEIFGSIVTHARAGDPEAALIVFSVAAEQRAKDESLERE
jgi:hypothetical protein